MSRLLQACECGNPDRRNGTTTPRFDPRLERSSARAAQGGEPSSRSAPVGAGAQERLTRSPMPAMLAGRVATAILMACLTERRRQGRCRAM